MSDNVFQVRIKGGASYPVQAAELVVGTGPQCGVALRDPVASESPTVVFLRLRLKTPDAKNPQPVVLPPCFPTLAPVLGRLPVTDGCVALEVASARVEPASDDGSASEGAGTDMTDSGDETASAEQEAEADAAESAQLGENGS